MKINGIELTKDELALWVKSYFNKKERERRAKIRKTSNFED